MSRWSYIVAVLQVDTMIDMDSPPDNAVEFLKDIIKEIPKITGSEQDAQIFLNQDSTYGNYLATCTKCPYRGTRVFKEGGFQCEAPSWYRCKGEEYNTRVTITISGYLRDKSAVETRKEYKIFKTMLKEAGIDIIRSCCKIT